jgi:putative glutamine amidotransferase
MRRRPVIGIPTQTQEAVPGQLPPCWIMGKSYITSLTALGALPWVIPLIADDVDTLRGIYEQLDGLFLAGGVDMNPATYGESPTSYCGRTDPDRDAVELSLTRWAQEDQMPILGVCRGIQVMNVAAGGALYQDVHAQHQDAIKHDYYPYHGDYTRDLRIHPVSLEPQTRLSHLFETDRIKVNSMHHQGIARLASAYRATSYAEDGLIESIEAPNGHFAIGVQWHPEEFVGKDAATDRLFKAFLSAAAN